MAPDLVNALNQHTQLLVASLAFVLFVTVFGMTGCGDAHPETAISQIDSSEGKSPEKEQTVPADLETSPPESSATNAGHNGTQKDDVPAKNKPVIPVPVRPSGVKNATSYEEGLKLAANEHRDLLIFVHGSDWCRPGERFKQSIWDDPKFATSLGDGFVRLSVDVLENPSEAQAEELSKRTKGFKVKFRTYPVLLLIDASGDIYETIAGSNYPQTLQETVDQISAARRDREIRDYFAQQAKKAKDNAEKASLLFEALQVDAGNQQKLLTLLKQADPKDEAGFLANVTFDRNKMLADSRALAANGKHKEAIQSLNEMLQESLEVEQQQWIRTAMGQVYRAWKGHEKEAYDAYMSAHELNPQSVPGIASLRLALKFVNPYAVEFDWNPSQSKTSAHDWEIDVSEAVRSAGVFQADFKYQKGASGLSIISVTLLDGDETISEDIHEGFAGGRSRKTSYRVTSPKKLVQPKLKVRTLTGPNTDSFGKMTFKQIGA